MPSRDGLVATAQDLAPPVADALASFDEARAAVRASKPNWSDGDVMAKGDREIRRGLSREGAGYSCRLADAGAGLLAREPNRTRSLVDARRRAAVAPPGRRHRERSLLGSAEVLARAVGDAEQAQAFRVRQAQSFEAEAHERAGEGGLIELALLEDAVKLYGDAGAGDDLQRLKPNLSAASKRAVDGLHVIESEVSIPRAAIEGAAKELVDRLGGNEQLLLGAADALGFWPSPVQVEADLDNAAAEHPLLFLVGHTALSADGRYQPDPATRLGAPLSAADAPVQPGHRGMAGGDRQCHRDPPGRGPMVVAGHDRGSRFRRGIARSGLREGFDALEAGRGWRAIHCLVPQLERAVRLVGLEIGANVMRRATRGGLRWASLEELLDAEAISAALQPRLSVALSRLFIDPFGPNYRNEVAHGAADPGGDKAISRPASPGSVQANRTGSIRRSAASPLAAPVWC